MRRHPTHPWAWGQGCGNEGPTIPGLESLCQVCRVTGPEKVPVDPSSGIVTPSLPPRHHRLHTWRGGCICASPQPVPGLCSPPRSPLPSAFVLLSLPLPTPHLHFPLPSPLPAASISSLFPSFPSSLHSPPHLLRPSSPDLEAGRRPHLLTCLFGTICMI